ncbi:MAG: hypothetical protein WCL71_11900 [Deltaproteobacteria bacterium]
MLLAGCLQDGATFSASQSHGTRASSVGGVNTGLLDSAGNVRVWGYAASKTGEAGGSARMILQRSAEADAQQMLSLVAGVHVSLGAKGLDVKGGSVVSMSVKEIRSTNGYYLVNASGPVHARVPEGMVLLKTEKGVASLAKMQFTYEVLSAAKRVLKGQSTGDKFGADGFLVLRKMELVVGVEPPKCSYEVDVYEKEH